MKKILIVGSGSYIGRSFIKYLESFQSEYVVSAIGARGFVPTPDKFKGYECVFCTVGVAHIKETNENRHIFYDINYDLVVRIAEAAKAAGVEQFILLSSMSVYGLITGNISKETKANPITAYGKSKLLADNKITEMTDESFSFTCIRPPMVYGKDCSGNYQRLRKLTLLSPLFPDINNQRSMVYIGNLCEFIKECIDKKKTGIYFPQNSEYVNTSEMVRLIAEYNGKSVRLTKAFNWIISMASFDMIQKVFGNLTYEKTDIVEKYSFAESIRETEKE